MSAPIDGAELATTTKPLESMLTGYLPPRGVINPLSCDADVSRSEIAGSGCSLAWSALKEKLSRKQKTAREHEKSPVGDHKSLPVYMLPDRRRKKVRDRRFTK